MGSVGCESTAAVHFSPSFCPIAGLWGCKSGRNSPRWGRFSLSTPQVRQAPRSALQRRLGRRMFEPPGGDPGRRPAGQLQAQGVQRHSVHRLWLPVSGQRQFAPVCGGQLHVHPLHRPEGLDHFMRRRASRPLAQSSLERDLRATGDEGREDVRLDAWLGPVADRSHRHIVLDLLEGLLDFGELDAELAQRRGPAGREMGAQQLPPLRAQARSGPVAPPRPRPAAARERSKRWNMPIRSRQASAPSRPRRQVGPRLVEA